MPRAKKQRLKQRKDGRYACRYKSQWFYGQTQEEALAMREQYKRIEAQGLFMPQTVREYGEKWLPRAHPEVAPSTMQGLKIHAEKLFSAVGDMMLDEVRPSDIKEIYSTQYKGVSDSYIKAGKQLFCGLFDAAVADGYISKNPARDRTAKPHKGKEGGHRAITEQEREWINTLCKDHRAHAAVMTMLYAGVRPPEAKAIVIERDFDLQNDLLTLHEFAHLDGSRYKRTSEGKTKDAPRTIPVFPPLKEAVAGKKGYLVKDASGRAVTISAWKSVWASYVTAMETEINGISKRWYGRTKAQKRLAEKGELPPWIEFTVVPYDLRHSFCTMCRDWDVELKTCVQWMGHADAKMIMKIYDEVSVNRSEKEAEKLKRTLFRSQNGSQDEKETQEML